ncbi:MAG TPA: hypothetical protein VGG08_05430 [Solirubrobacteraceae bacterium]|jgi:hypothetical protein
MSAQGQEGQPSEEELRAAYEAELSRITASDMVLQAAVSLLNVGAYRMGAPAAEGEEPAGRDLDQVRDAVDGAGALLKIAERRLPAQELAPLRDALSHLQMAYAREAPAVGAGAEGPGGGGGPEPGAPGGGAAPAEPREPSAQPPEDVSGAGPAERSGRLWVPGR